MRSIRRLDQYLCLCQDIWHYVLRVPKEVKHIEKRARIDRSLNTDSRKVARQRRDICAAADEHRWAKVAPNVFGGFQPGAVLKDLHQHAQTLGYD